MKKLIVSVVIMVSLFLSGCTSIRPDRSPVAEKNLADFSPVLNDEYVLDYIYHMNRSASIHRLAQRISWLVYTGGGSTDISLNNSHSCVLSIRWYENINRAVVSFGKDLSGHHYNVVTNSDNVSSVDLDSCVGIDPGTDLASFITGQDGVPVSNSTDGNVILSFDKQMSLSLRTSVKKALKFFFPDVNGWVSI